jgi:hypothetical protein
MEARGVPEWESLVYTPAVFVRVANKGVTGYVTWKSAQRTENKGFANAPFAREIEIRSENGG